MDEFVADDIAFVKVGEFDAIGGGEGGEGFDELVIEASATVWRPESVAS